MTFLYELGDDCPYLIWKDRLFALQEDLRGLDFVMMRDRHYHLEESESLPHLEDIAFQDEFVGLIKGNRPDHDETIRSFLESFLDYFIHPVSHAPELIQVVAPHREVRPHEPGEPSFFSACFPRKSFLLHEGHLWNCWEPFPHAEAYGCLDQERMSFVKSIPLESADPIYGTYARRMLEIRSHRIALDSPYGSARYLDVQESRGGEVGWKSIGKDFFLYIRKPAFAIFSEKAEKNFLFPSCKLGVHVILRDDGVIDYDCAAGGDILILEAKRVSQGRETSRFRSLKGEDFNHPASSRANGDLFPYLCMTGKDSDGKQYSFLHPEHPEDSFPVLRQVLLDAFDRIERYSDERTKNTLFAYLDAEQFRENEVRAGW